LPADRAPVAQPLPPGVRRCELHDVTYGALEQCSACRAAKGISVKAGAPKADTHELRLREQEYRETDKYLRRIAREWLDDGTAQERGIALKAFDAAAKFARISLEIHTSIKELEHDQWLVEQKRLLGGSSN
jgi:hypothetical protein